ncbi:MAG: response regulator [Lachnospiraceae bacterium]|nr:response regulator [Lachnospiraceae bacterium]
MNDRKSNALFQASHLMILVSYTLFSAILIGESLLLGWETWALLPIALGVLCSWVLHITQALTEYYRIWVYSLLMMLTFFFYGIHQTSMYDTATVMGVTIMLYSMTGISELIFLCVSTYYVTMLYDLVAYVQAGEPVDALMVTRTLLHVMLIFMAGWVARLIVKKWGQVLNRADVRIQELTDASRRMDDFLANVSHEIRTPINAVIGLSTVMENRERDAETKKDLRAVGDAGRRVAEQIGDILDYTEIDMKKLAVTRENYMISSLINDLVTQMQMLLRPNVELIFDVDASIPSALVGDAIKIRKILWHLIANGLKFTSDGGVYVHIYTVPRDYGVNLCMEVTDTGVGMTETEAEHSFRNFYQLDSGRSRAVGGLGLGIPIVDGFARSMGGFFSLESEPGKGTKATVSIPQAVADASPCMSLKSKEKVCAATFFRFAHFEAPQIREFYQAMIGHIGHGLGFPIHYVNELEELKQLHKNVELTHLFTGVQEYLSDPAYLEGLARSIRVIIIADENFTPSAGSAMQILRKPICNFPIVNALNVVSLQEDADAEQRERFYCPGVKALVVDDERMNLMVAEGIFKSYGMKVTTVISGPEAIKRCRKEHFDVIFMDHMMPEMDGVEAMKRIRADAGKQGDDMIMIALTANAVSSAREMFLSEGFNGFVPKPIELAELERVLRRELPKSMIRYDLPPEMQTPVPEEPAADRKLADSPYAALDHVGINTADGLRYCMNDVDFYHSLLLEFGRNAAEKHRELKEFFAEEDWKNYAIRIHAVKSTSRMIGASGLSEMAMRLENAAKEENGNAIAAEHAKMLSLYGSMADTILRVCGADTEGEDTEHGEDILEFAPEEEASSAPAPLFDGSEEGRG